MVIEGSIDKLGREALAGGRYVIEVETVKPGPQLVEAIKGINGVRSVEASDNILLVNADSDMRAEIAKAVVQNDFPLIQVKVQEFSLDNIYMKYFSEG